MFHSYEDTCNDIDDDTEFQKQILIISHKKQLHIFMKYFENLLREKKDGNGWLIAHQMTWADIGVILFTTGWLERINVVPCWEDYPLLKGLKERIETLPQSWLRQMPQTPS